MPTALPTLPLSTRRTRAALALLLCAPLAACPEPAALDLQGRPPPETASVRFLVLVPDRESVDAWLALPGEVPTAFNGVASPGVTAFRPHPEGESGVFLSAEARTLTRASARLQAGGRYTVFSLGRTEPGAEPPVQLGWFADPPVEAPPEGRARVRFLHGAVSSEPGRAVLRVAPPGGDLDAAAEEELAVAPELGSPSVLREVEAGEARLELWMDQQLAARFLFALPEGAVTTLVLANVPGPRGVALLVVDEATSRGTTVPPLPEE